MNTGNDSPRRVGALQELPQEVPPGRDLWPDIASRLGSAQSQPLAPPPRNANSTWLPAVAVAASVALVAIGVWIGGHMQGSVPRVAESEGPGVMIRAALMDADYQRQRTELLQSLPAKLAQLPPEAQQRVSESLRSISQAMQSIEAELGRDSGNALLQQLLISACQEEIRVLTAVRDAGGMEGRI